jgi:hypothetical protein
MNKPDEDKIELSQESKRYLKGAGNWAKFLAILGFIGIGIMVVFGLSFGAIMSAINPDFHDLPAPEMAFGLIYIIIAIVYFFPVLYLYRFVIHCRRAVSLSDSFQLSEAFKNLKLHYQFIGILAIILIGIYIIAGLVMLGVFMIFN